MISVLVSSVLDRGFERFVRVKPTTIKLVSVDYLLSVQYYHHTEN